MKIGLLCSAILVESVGIPIFLFSEPLPWSGMTVLTIHIAASLAVGYSGTICLPEGGRAPRWGMMGLFSGLTVFIPALGAIGVLLIVVLAHRQRRPSDREPVQHLPERPPSRTKSLPAAPLSTADFQGRLTSSAVPVPARLETLGKLRTLSVRQATMLFRQALSDEVEDIRLVAFGILDKKEQAIQTRINQALERYEQSADEEERAEYARVLAMAFWELAYQELVQGDIAMHVLSQARRYAYEALRADERDAGLWALVGQIALRLEDWDEARTALHLAERYGVPESRVVPYLAELAFRDKDFGSVSTYLTKAVFVDDVPILQPVVAYWRSTAEPSRDRRGSASPREGSVS